MTHPDNTFILIFKSTKKENFYARPVKQGRAQGKSVK